MSSDIPILHATRDAFDLGRTSDDPSLLPEPRRRGRPKSLVVTTVLAARVPVSLYKATQSLVKGPGKPSWGQLIAQACRSEPEAVLSAVMAQLAPPDESVPRGNNRAANSSTQLTPRFIPSELKVFDETLDRANAAAMASPAGSIVSMPTATSVIIAALEVASKRKKARS